MANIDGKNYAKEFSNIPSEAADIGEYGGRKKIIFDEFSGAAGLDTVNFGKIPPGARILALSEIGGGTAPTFSHSVGDKIGASGEILICTLDADAAATGMIWIEYILD
jgi:hypothetical protein